ncbi:MAG: L,D-transpeptidase family protein [Hyphomicrobiales bacterium]|nr:L,D-transpeptidase family protein [Hyphomicrobiales bacterium]
MKIRSGLTALLAFNLVFGGATIASAQSSGNSEAALTPATTQQPQLSPLQQAIQSQLAQLPRKGKTQKARAAKIAQWYEARNFAPLWVADGKVTGAAEQTVYQLLTAYKDGLDAKDYGGGELFASVDAKTPSEMAAFEVKLSLASVIYGQHLRTGRVAPNSINRELVIYPEQLAADNLLTRLSNAAAPADELASLPPQTQRYFRLRSHLIALKLQEADGGWVSVPEGEVLKPDMEDERVPVLRQRLIQSGDLAANAHTGNVYDGALVEALKRFQARTGLAIDGVIGPTTLSQLNITIQERIELVALNLERRRWMQADFGDTYIFVNLADQVLKLVKNDKTLHAELVQVGRPYHRTPVFSDEMEYLEFNPFWNVPYSIATKEYLPKLKQNPYALQSQQIRVLSNGRKIDPGAVPWNSYSRANFPVRLRQDPNPKNALGRVKFMFPNKFNVYIHDTPSKSKFAKDSRYFSHGCVRLKSPMDLAEKILGFQSVSCAKIDGIVDSKKRTVVKLKEKLPVHVTYLTAWVNKDGSAHYRRDIYGRDKILAKALGKNS